MWVGKNYFVFFGDVWEVDGILERKYVKGDWVLGRFWVLIKIFICYIWYRDREGYKIRRVFMILNYVVISSE